MICFDVCLLSGVEQYGLSFVLNLIGVHIVLKLLWVKWSYSNS